MKTQKAVVWQRRNYTKELEEKKSQYPVVKASSSKNPGSQKLSNSQRERNLGSFNESMGGEKSSRTIGDGEEKVGYELAVWQETQPAEEDESTWDRVGDMDYKEKFEKKRR